MYAIQIIHNLIVSTFSDSFFEFYSIYKSGYSISHPYNNTIVTCLKRYFANFIEFLNLIRMRIWVINDIRKMAYVNALMNIRVQDSNVINGVRYSNNAGIMSKCFRITSEVKRKDLTKLSNQHFERTQTITTSNLLLHK